LINYNTNIINKSLTTAAINEINENIICCAIGCNDHANSSITLTAGTRTFNFKVCKSCKKKLEN